MKQKPEDVALQIWLSSANLENDFKPISFIKLSAELWDKHRLSVSKSTLARWSKKYSWGDHLQIMQQACIIKNPIQKKDFERESLKSNVTQTLVDLERNNVLTAACYEVLEQYALEILKDFRAGKKINKDDIKIIKDIASFTAGREDKMLDRVALLNASSGISADKVLQELRAVDVEFEADTLTA